MPVKIQVEISSCQECQFHKIDNRWSSDGWDRMEDWIYTKAGRKIAGCVEWHDKIEIPSWCPIRVEPVVEPLDFQI